MNKTRTLLNCRTCGQEPEVDGLITHCPKCGAGYIDIDAVHMVDCECGRTVILSGWTNKCECGRAYNRSGQELAPVSDWPLDVRFDTFGPQGGLDNYG